jgi:hypothetical protein
VIIFTGKFSPNFKLKKYDFNLYKGFFIEKMAQTQQISKLLFLPNGQIFPTFNFLI